jgi:hypothetical protein
MSTLDKLIEELVQVNFDITFDSMMLKYEIADANITKPRISDKEKKKDELISAVKLILKEQGFIETDLDDIIDGMINKRIEYKRSKMSEQELDVM